MYSIHDHDSTVESGVANGHFDQDYGFADASARHRAMFSTAIIEYHIITNKRAHLIEK